MYHRYSENNLYLILKMIAAYKYNMKKYALQYSK